MSFRKLNAFTTANSNSIASKTLNDVTKLFREISEIVSTTGLSTSTQRTIQVLKAISVITTEFLESPKSYYNDKNEISIPKTLRRLFEELGATYVKLGQFIASSPTLFPSEYVLEFQSCLDKAPPVPYFEIKKIIQKELTSSKPIGSVFSYIDPNPIATASIAQVHKAILRQNGKEVVLKVRKPGVDTTLKADLSFLLIATKLTEFINPSLSRLSIVNIIGDLRSSMLDELDFRKETNNILNFRKFLNDNNIIDAVAPEPYVNLCSERLLVMEYLKGVPLIDLQGIKKYSKNPENTLISALQTWGLSVTNNDIFHADVHGGNLLVLEDGRIGFIDFGIVGKVPEKVWKALGLLTKSFVESDYNGVANALVSMGATDSTVDISKFSKEIEEVFNKILTIQPTITLQTSDYGASLDATIAINDKETTELVLQVVEVADKNGLKLPREFGLLLKQALYFDRYQKILAPELDPLRDIRVRSALKENEFLYSDSESIPKSSIKGKIIDTDILNE